MVISHLHSLKRNQNVRFSPQNHLIHFVRPASSSTNPLHHRDLGLSVAIAGRGEAGRRSQGRLGKMSRYHSSAPIATPSCQTLSCKVRKSKTFYDAGFEERGEIREEDTPAKMSEEAVEAISVR